MTHNDPNTNVPASIDYLKRVAPKRQGNLDWWKERMARAA